MEAKAELIPYEQKALAEYPITLEEIQTKAQEFMALKVIPDDAKSYKIVREAHTMCVHTRTSIDKRRKELNEEYQARIKGRNEAAKKLINAFASAEEHLDQELGREDGRKKEIRERKEKEERERVEKIRAKIDSLKVLPLSLQMQPSAMIQESINVLSGSDITAEEFQEFQPEAAKTKGETLDILDRLYSERVQVEKEEAARKAEAERLEKVRQEQEVERQRQEEERKRLDDIRKADEEKIRKEREAIEVEKRKIQEDKDRAEFERQTKERIEREAIEKYAREQREKREKEEAEAKEKARQEALRPDKEKLIAFADKVMALASSNLDVQSKNARAIFEQALDNIMSISDWIKNQAEAL